MTTVFDATTNGTASETKDSMFKALVGETQKYKSEEDLAKAYVHADAFIEQLKEENKRLKQEVESKATIDEVLARIDKQSVASEQKEAPQSLDPTAVTTLVKETVSGLLTEQNKTANLLAADKLMKEKFGEKAAEVFTTKATTPELKKALMEVAATNPQEFLKLFETQANAGVVDTSTRSFTTVNTNSDPATVEGTKAWASKVRKDNPALYYSQEFQYKLQNLVTKNPDLYFGR